LAQASDTVPWMMTFTNFSIMKGLLLLAISFQCATALVIRNATDAAKSSEPAAAPLENEAQVHNGRPVFYAVIMGRLALGHQVSLWLSSLRKLGNWSGEAIIATDRPTCLAQTLKEAGVIGGHMLKTTENVDVWGPGEGYQGNLHMVKRPITDSINMMKLEKARAWHNVKVAELPMPVSSIVYTDEDIVIGKDLTEFMKYVHSLEKLKFTLALFNDTGVMAGELHTGIVVMFPGARTDSCLQAWGKELTGRQIGSALPAANVLLQVYQEHDMRDKNMGTVEAASKMKVNQLTEEEQAAMGPDQQALGRTKQCKESPDSMGIKIMPDNFFWLPTASGLKKDHVNEFIHFTNTWRWKQLSYATGKEYLKRIGIPKNIDPEGEAKSMYCAIPEDGNVKDVKKVQQTTEGEHD